MKKLKILILAFILVPVLVLFTACAGTEGKQGPQGPQGAQGPQGENAPGAMSAQDLYNFMHLPSSYIAKGTANSDLLEKSIESVNTVFFGGQESDFWAVLNTNELDFNRGITFDIDDFDVDATKSAAYDTDTDGAKWQRKLTVRASAGGDFAGVKMFAFDADVQDYINNEEYKLDGGVSAIAALYEVISLGRWGSPEKTGMFSASSPGEVFFFEAVKAGFYYVTMKIVAMEETGEGDTLVEVGTVLATYTHVLLVG